MRAIPESEIAVDYARSSGPGGQNVNKRDTKAVVRWKVGDSTAFSEEEKVRIRSFAANRLNADDEIVLAADEERSQAQNRAAAVSRLREIVRRALIPAKKRRPTMPTRASKERRLESKRLQGRKKADRRRPRQE
jgi:ribosome-associated protein